MCPVEQSSNLSRRDALRLGVAATASLAAATVWSPTASAAPEAAHVPPPNQRNSLFRALDPYYPGTEKLGAHEMRITFMGTSFLPRLSQACNSVFVELGNGDNFVFDAGSGVIEKYVAMGITYAKMDKIFITHLHADHMSDLSTIYCFGPSGDRKWPLYLWGPSKSEVPDPVTGEIYDDGIVAFSATMRSMLRWHSEAFSFLPTSYTDYVPPPWDPGQHKDGYDLVPIELNWRTVGGVAYDYNGVRITHFPAVHDRQGSISYKLEWDGLSMIFSGDTKPSQYVIDAASSGVDVLIHEMVVPVDVWAAKNSGLQPGDPGWDQAVNTATIVQENSHTPQKAFGYLLSQIPKPPRLAVGTHFQAEDDTIKPALKDIRTWYPKGEVTVANDLMVLNVTKRRIRQRRAVVSSYAWLPPAQVDSSRLAIPKYHTASGQPDPYAQLDPKAPVIPEATYDAR